MDYANLINPDEVGTEPYIFVSYSRKDMDSVQLVLHILRENHFRFWYDKGLKSGQEWAEELGNRIARCEQFMVLISPNAVSSRFVPKEVSLAVERNKSILVVYLEETDLSNGLQFLLGGIQAVHRAFFKNAADFHNAVCLGLSSAALYQISNHSQFLLGSLGSKQLADYEIVKQIGAGCVSEVYLAKHKRTGVLAAVKFSRSSPASLKKLTKDTVSIFNTEKEALTRLTNSLCPYTPIIYDWLESDFLLCIVETYIDGESLRQPKDYTEIEVVDIAKQVLHILQHLHENNIVHRDIKPDNLILDNHGNVHLIDFNAAIIKDTPQFCTIMMGGTVGYSPPEQFAHDAPIHFSDDLYALGRTMQYLLCPLKFDKDLVAPVRYYRKDVSPELESILAKMTAPSFEDRYQSVQELLQDIDTYQENGFIDKIVQFLNSRKRVHTFEMINKETAEKFKNEISELAHMNLDSTVITNG